MNLVKKSMLIACGLAVSASLVGCDCKKSCNDEKCKTEEGKKVKTMKKCSSADFYTADNKLDVAKYKKAYFELMESFDYPIVDRLKGDEFWVCDFKQKDGSTVGMGGIFWMNEKGTYGESGNKGYNGPFKGQKFGYLGHDIYLLPGQTLPEHRHVGGAEGYGPKVEAWQVRHGNVRFYSEVPVPKGKLISELPEKERPFGFGQDWCKSKYYVDAKPGEVVVMADPETWHFQQAGEEGAIVTEYASYHNHVEFSKPGMEFKNTGDQ